ncbi:SMP-30/gluconolactonase/LRE family protein [Actinomadura fibrosa]|uniref:SMP-30/gluconolactonase/LRE family protein n=1 Tax=Actinomadura fibrosa TaxID=111802 RepID=A0ABW2XV21_9ACTN|nr:SMP-30/gluconolactonase/LRE family protein [Actinomadura fibrosa]
MSGGAEVAERGPAALGESPVWDAAAGRLLWVDVLGCEVRAHDPSGGSGAVLVRTAQHVGAVRPRAGGGLVANLRDGAGLYDRDGAFRWLAEWPEDGCRGNDAAVAPDGAFWAGTMRYDEAHGGGRLRRVTADGAVGTVLDRVTVSNGVAWSPDGRLVYYVDTPTGRVDVLNAGGASGGRPFSRRPFASVPPPGLPDGLTVDADGCVWVALWGGGRVLRFTPSGTLDRVVEIPARQTTACAFGGPGLRDLYVTTATTGAPPDDALAGALFVVPDAGAGLPSPAFPG